MPVTVSAAGRAYALLVNSFTNAASGTVISPADANTAHADLATAVNVALGFAPVDGQRRVMGIQANTATPPVSPAEGQVWLVAPGGAGVFSGKDKKYAVYVSASWTFFDPAPGDTAIVVSTRQSFIHDASGTWQPGNALAGANGNITSLSGLTTPLSVAQGGTAGNTAATARAGIGAAVSGANNDITSLSGLTTPLSLAQGGTTGTNAPTARAGIGAAAAGANNDITSLGALSTPLSVAQGGTGANTTAGATAALNVFTSGLKGLVPASGGGSSAFLRADGVFSIPNAGGVRTITTTDTLVASDNGRLAVVSGGASFTLSLTSAATLGNGWFVMLKALSPILVTLSPTGGQLIDGLASIPLAQGQECTLVCDGSNFRTVGLQNDIRILATTSSNVAAIDLTLPPGYDRFTVILSNLLALVGGQDVLLRTSVDNGASFAAGASDYAIGYEVPNGVANRFWGVNSGNACSIYQRATAGNPSLATVNIVKPRSGGVKTQIASFGSGDNSGAGYTNVMFSGVRNTAEDNNALRLFAVSGNISASVTLIGNVY
ncbi:MAG: DUF2793 domain-containing protein [Rhizobiales bacterium]|nr:DUF2793 domain-containing protein [Hyphomicrobiales bacterium]